MGKTSESHKSELPLSYVGMHSSDKGVIKVITAFGVNHILMWNVVMPLLCAVCKQPIDVVDDSDI